MDQPQEPDQSQNESLADVPPTPMDVAQAPKACSMARGAIILTAGAVQFC